MLRKYVKILIYSEPALFGKGHNFDLLQCLRTWQNFDLFRASLIRRKSLFWFIIQIRKKKISRKSFWHIVELRFLHFNFLDSGSKHFPFLFAVLSRQLSRHSSKDKVQREKDKRGPERKGGVQDNRRGERVQDNRRGERGYRTRDRERWNTSGKDQ